MVVTNPMGYGGDGVGAAASPIARDRRPAMGSDRLQPHALRICLR